jgi:hypothetical protein
MRMDRATAKPFTCDTRRCATRCHSTHIVTIYNEYRGKRVGGFWHLPPYREPVLSDKAPPLSRCHGRLPELCQFVTVGADKRPLPWCTRVTLAASRPRDISEQPSESIRTSQFAQASHHATVNISLSVYWNAAINTNPLLIANFLHSALPL